MTDALAEAAFDRIADQTLHSILNALSNEEDFEVDLSSGVLTVRFEDGKRYVVNSHRAARQIWMAAESNAWHFDWTGTQWLSTKSKDELWELIERITSKKMGRAIKLRGSPG